LKSFFIDLEPAAWFQ